jgi:hypothetical protein
MAFTVHVRELVRKKIDSVASEMKSWEAANAIPDAEAKIIKDSIQQFGHTISVDSFVIAGVDGSGDYPSFTYADSCVYVASATGTAFKTSAVHGLEEIPLLQNPVIEVIWLPGDRTEAAKRWDVAFEALAGVPVASVIGGSDYRGLKRYLTGDKSSVSEIAAALIRPAGSDTSNVAIQLRSTAELGAALRMVISSAKCRYVINDTTFSLPMITRKELSLFYEHVKRLCCVEARKREITYAALSKSHGFRCMDLVESYAREALGLHHDESAEHWFFRLPIPGIDSWQFTPVEGRVVPPPGAVTYLFRLHRNTPVMRLDIDREWWEVRFRGDPAAEKQMFCELDYCGHDQRAYGYPYPIKACHDRVRLSEDERRALKNMIMEAAIAKGLPAHVFRDVSMATGHC